MNTRTRISTGARDAGGAPTDLAGRIEGIARSAGLGDLAPWLLASTAIHAGILAVLSVASVFIGSTFPGEEPSGRDRARVVLRVKPPAEMRATHSPARTEADPVMAALLDRTKALSDLPVEERVAALEQRAERATRMVRRSSIEEIGRHLGIAAPPPLEGDPTDPRHLDGSTLTLLDVRSVGDGRYCVRLADGAGRWSEIEVADPDDEDGWAAAAAAMSMLRSNPRLAAIYDRCVGPLLPRLAAGLAADTGEDRAGGGGQDAAPVD